MRNYQLNGSFSLSVSFFFTRKIIKKILRFVKIYISTLKTILSKFYFGNTLGKPEKDTKLEASRLHTAVTFFVSIARCLNYIHSPNCTLSQSHTQSRLHTVSIACTNRLDCTLSQLHTSPPTVLVFHLIL